MKQKQHYLSRFYLAFFADPADGQSLYVYEKGGKDIRKSRPEHEAFRKDYYAVMTADGRRDTATMEQEMARVEGLWKPSLTRIVDRNPVDAQDRLCVASFIALTALRSPLFHEHMQRSWAGRYEKDWNRDRQAMLERSGPAEALASKWRGRFQCSDEDFRAMLKMEVVKLDIPLEKCIQAINWSTDFADMLTEMKWQLAVAPPGHYFVTSDTPVFLAYADPQSIIEEQGVSRSDIKTFPALLRRVIRHPKTDVTFPICPQVALSAGWGCHEGYFNVSAEDIAAINRRTIISAERWVYASVKSDALNREVQSHTGSRKRLIEG